MRKDLRGGRVFLDYLRNSRGATAIAPYSTRAREGATVAAPLSWDELTADFDPRAFDLRSMLKRVNQPDPWREYAKLTAQSINSKALRSLGVKD
jgi:bifunctional non-homologous end joining protein LigD